VVLVNESGMYQTSGVVLRLQPDGTSTLTDITVNGGNVIQYNSCKVKSALTGGGVRIVNWKQVY